MGQFRKTSLPPHGGVNPLTCGCPIMHLLLHKLLFPSSSNTTNFISGGSMDVFRNNLLYFKMLGRCFVVSHPKIALTTTKS